MARTLADLKANRESSLSKLKESVAKMSNGGGGRPPADQRYWKPTVGKDGNGSAVIRFLDSPEGEDVPYVQLFTVGFKGVGGWYIANSLTTIGLEDPVGKFNAALWASSEDDKGPERTQVRKQKRKLNFISNILVVKDPGNRDNEGKVFLFKYGKKIFDMLNKKMNPQHEDIEAMNPFDFFEGANFRLFQTTQGEFPNYDSSEFASPSAIAGGDEEEILRIANACYSLQAEIAPDKFESYEVLEKRLNKALTAPTVSKESKPADDEPEEDRFSAPPKRTLQAPTKAAPVESELDDDDEDYFAKLAAGK